MTSAVFKAKLQYSASVLDRTTTECFLNHQYTKLEPKKTAAPEVDLLHHSKHAERMEVQKREEENQNQN